MKVGTDGVLLGAWADVSKAKCMLDIGTGTGLIALMLAQRSAAVIDAVEIESSAYHQATENVKASQWKDRINVFHQSIQDFSKTQPKFYDLIVSNPPYFSRSFSSADKQKQLARHTDSLSFEALIRAVNSLLAPKGVFSLILPTDQAEHLINIAQEQNLFLFKELRVYPTQHKPEKRRLMSFSRQATVNFLSESLIIEPKQRHQYSPEYIALTKDFYLKF